MIETPERHFRISRIHMIERPIHLLARRVPDVEPDHGAVPHLDILAPGMEVGRRHNAADTDVAGLPDVRGADGYGGDGWLVG
jgi:hypothetical protein